MVLEHIQKLLFDHDCVIMPDFGGLITHYEPAKIHPVRHTFLPPAKRVAFNEKLKQNDGLLVSTLAYNHKLSTEEAQQQVTRFVRELQRELNQNQRFDLQGIGIFSLNREGKIIFEYIQNENYLHDSFGLPELLSKPILATEPVILRTLLKEQQTPVKAGFRHIIRKYYRAATALVIGGVAVTGLYLLSLQTHYNVSAINPITLFQSDSQQAPSLKKPAVKPSVTEVVQPTGEGQKETIMDSFENSLSSADSSILIASASPSTAPEMKDGLTSISSEKINNESGENTIAKKTQIGSEIKKVTIAPGEAILISAKANAVKSTPDKVSREPASESQTVRRNFSTEEINAALAKDNSKLKPESTNTSKAEEATNPTPANNSANNKIANRVENPVNASKSGAPATIKPKAERFYIIVNGYSTYANAERNRKIIALKGRPGQIIAPFGGAKLYRIAIAEYSSRDQAIQNLPELKNKYGNTIWILKR